LGPKKADPHLGWRESEIHIRDLVDVDTRGFQEVHSTQPPQQHVVILGGSVAFGAYASSIGATYFAQLTKQLEGHGLPIRLTLITSGGWYSDHELMAFLLYGRQLAPDAVLLLDGLNDLTEHTDAPVTDRVAAYLSNVRAVAEICRARHVPLVVVLQPSLTEKPNKTSLESRVLELVDPDGQIAQGVAALRKELQRSQEEGLLHFIDGSSVFNGERATTFADLWHFSDAGHALLAQELAHQLLPILTSVSALARPRAVNK
jgi:lysophospholipase L1-like esterase